MISAPSRRIRAMSIGMRPDAAAMRAIDAVLVAVEQCRCGGEHHRSAVPTAEVRHLIGLGQCRAAQRRGRHAAASAHTRQHAASEGTIARHRAQDLVAHVEPSDGLLVPPAANAMSPRMDAVCRRRSDVASTVSASASFSSTPSSRRVAGGDRLPREQVRELIEPKRTARRDRLLEKLDRGRNVALDPERHGQVLLSPAELDERTRFARELDGLVEPFGGSPAKSSTLPSWTTARSCACVRPAASASRAWRSHAALAASRSPKKSWARPSRSSAEASGPGPTRSPRRRPERCRARAPHRPAREPLVPR